MHIYLNTYYKIYFLMRQNKLSQARLRNKLATIQTPNLLEMFPNKQKKPNKIQQAPKKQTITIKSTSRIISSKILSKSIMHQSDVQLKRPQTTKLRQKSIHITKKNASVLIKNKTIDLSKNANESKLFISRRKSLVNSSNSTSKIQSLGGKLGDKLIEKKILTDHIKELYLQPQAKNKIKANPKYGNFIIDAPSIVKKKLNMDIVKTQQNSFKKRILQKSNTKDYEQLSNVNQFKDRHNQKSQIKQHEFGTPAKKTIQSTPYLIKSNSVQQGVNTSNTLLKMYLNPQTIQIKHPLLKKAAKLVNTCNLIPQHHSALSKKQLHNKFGELTEMKLNKGFNTREIYLIDFLPKKI